MEKYINVIAGRAGAGKTYYIEQEIGEKIKDPNKIVVLIDRQPPEKYMRMPDVAGDVESVFGQRDIMHEMLPQNLIYYDYAHAAEGIGKAIDAATAMDQSIPVYLYYDQARYMMPVYIRDMLVAAGRAGVEVTVVAQLFSQVDREDSNWLKTHCYADVISKHRPPRRATLEEINEVYR
mgnify:FL=1